MSYAAEAQELSLDLELDYAFHRASPDAACATCNRPFRRHPLDTSKLSQDGRPFLRVLCDGRRVRL